MTQSKCIIDSWSWIFDILFTDKLSNLFSVYFIIIDGFSPCTQNEFILQSLFFSSGGCPQHGVGGGLQ